MQLIFAKERDCEMKSQQKSDLYLCKHSIPHNKYNVNHSNVHVKPEANYQKFFLTILTNALDSRTREVERTKSQATQRMHEQNRSGGDALLLILNAQHANTANWLNGIFYIIHKTHYRNRFIQSWFHCRSTKSDNDRAGQYWSD